MMLIAAGSFIIEKPFKLALVQMKVTGGERSENVHRAGERIDEAAENGAEVVLLPEAMDLGWTHPSALTEAQSIPDGETCRLLIQKAQQHNLYICSGLVEKDEQRVFNSAVLIDPAGEVILKHRKINELDIGWPFYELGDRLNVVDTPLARIGVMICADAIADGQVLTRSLGSMGADVILSPCSWAVPANYDNTVQSYGGLWKNAYAPVAKDFSAWIIGVSNVGLMSDGPWKGWKGIGNSLAVNPEGEAVLWGPHGEEAEKILYVDITPSPAFLD
jgi:predicted amidohydrolase